MRHLAAILILLCCMILGFGIHAGAQYSPLRVKAAFLFNFAQFTSWPSEHSPQQVDGLVVGIMGRDPFGKIMQEFRDKKILGGPVHLKAVSTLEEARSCHILFIAASEASHVKQILRQLNQSAVLTVSDIPGFATQGGIIELFEIEQHIRFAINLDASRNAKLILSAHLLKLARNVLSEKRGTP